MKAVLLVALVGLSVAQQVGTNTPENHPPITTYACKSKGQCATEKHMIVLDSNWRWLHNNGGSQNCYTGNLWDESLCPDPQACAKNCALDGADYSGTYGITTSSDKLSIKFVTHGPYSTNIGSRVYLMETDTKYKIFKLLNHEFTFDVDVSKMPCGLNGALYFVEMEENGGLGKGNNKAGAKYGTGYCDGQCPHDIKFINGEANVLEWKPSDDDPNAGTGKYGTCCGEMDIWEANSMSTAYTAHDCSKQGLYRCSGTECGDNGDDRYKGVCDKDGCDFNAYRLTDTTFYGTGSQFKLDTTKTMTVVTQFVTDNGKDTGNLVEIRRLWVQNGKVIANTNVTVSGDEYNSLSDKFCNAEKELFGDVPDFAKKGGMKAHGQMLNRGVVLVMSLWDDHYAHMLWLDSQYPLDKDPSIPGVARGPCDTSSGVPSDVESQHPDATVVFSKIKFGPLDTTY